MSRWKAIRIALLQYWTAPGWRRYFGKRQLLPRYPPDLQRWAVEMAEKRREREAHPLGHMGSKPVR